MAVTVMGGDNTAPRRSQVVEDATARVVEITNDAEAEVLEAGVDFAVVHIVEPFAVLPAAFGLELDDLTDVAANNPPLDVPLSLVRDHHGVYRLVAASGTADQFLLRGELGAPNGVARLDANGLLRADERPASSYHHEQIGVSTVWPIPHMLPFDPAGIEVFDPTGHRHYPKTISHPEPGLTVLTFVREIRGTAELS